MQLIRGLNNFHLQQACAATIGNFDGVHRGHQQLLQHLVAVAKEHQLLSLVILFEPHPREFFSPSKAPARLTRLREKLMLLQDQAIDYVLCLHFNQTLAAMSAENFVTEILQKKLHVNYLLVGNDFRFGHQRAGDVVVLKKLAAITSMQVDTSKDFVLQEQRVSSTAIRQALAADDFKLAEQLLGRRYSMVGKVVRGSALGRQLGYPTANILLRRQVSPLHGIYVVQIFVKDRLCNGVASIGNRPTVDGEKMLLEVYIFDFNSDIYGQTVRVDFLKKIRNEEKFLSLDILKDYIARDVAEAIRFFYK